MATVSNVTMSVASASAITSNVTVNGTLTFDANDVGKTYHLAITLVGEDLQGDKLPAGDPVGDDDVYAFTWGPLPSLKKPYRAITVSAPGTQTFTETRALTSSKLDEDAGVIPVNQKPDIHTPIPGIPRRDEMYARATLSGAPVSARSATVVTGIGA